MRRPTIEQLTADRAKFGETAFRGSFATSAGDDVSWIWAAAPLWIAYALVFAGTEGSSLWRALRDSAANVAPLILIALLTRAFLPRLIAGRPTPVQAAIHIVASLSFSASWYSLVGLLLGGLSWLDGNGFRLAAFTGPALAWQILQGAIMYCAVAALVSRREINQNSDKTWPRHPLFRFLTRDGEGFRIIDVANIVTISGAVDYAEVSTLNGKHLVRMSLGDFEGRLDASHFVRVHRSAIIHLAFLDRLEPAGSGRMLAVMRNGETIPVSRSGAQTLRSFAV